MRIYIVERKPETVDWDEYDSIVVKAKNEESARKQAVEFQFYFGEHNVELSEVHLDDIEGVIHESYRAG